MKIKMDTTIDGAKHTPRDVESERANERESETRNDGKDGKTIYSTFVLLIYLYVPILRSLERERSRNEATELVCVCVCWCSSSSGTSLTHLS